MRTAALLLFVATSAVAAEGPETLLDRSYFTLRGAGGLIGARSVTDRRIGTVYGPSRAGFTQFGLGYGVEIYDWLHLDLLDADALDLSLESLCECTENGLSGIGFRFSPMVRIVAPLRYVGPYVGVGPYMLLPFVGSGTTNKLQGTTGPLFGLRAYAGMAIYVARYFDLFLEYQPLPLDLTVNMRTMPAEAPAGEQRIDGGFGHSFVLGVRVTPELYRTAGHPEFYALGYLGSALFMGGLMAFMSASRANP